MRLRATEPVAVVGAVQAVMLVLVSFGALHVIGLDSQGDVMLVAGVLNAAAALYLAARTDRTLLAPVVELFKALAAAAVIYGFHMDDVHTGLVIAAITAIFAAIHRSKVSPV